MFIFLTAHYRTVLQALGLIVVGAPTLLVVVLGISSLVGRPLSERVTGRSVAATVVSGLLASLLILGYMIASGSREVPIHLGNWVEVPDYHFSVNFVFDWLSAPFTILTFVLCGTVGSFATKYMHREQGFNRFFVFYGLFLLGMVVASLAGTIETLFAGWELVGLSSALLVAFYQERPAPVQNGLWIWSIYRVADAALLIAAVVMHQMAGQGDFVKMVGGGPWPEADASFTPQQALIVGLLLLAAAAGKSALVPFSGWLPRAMEGPTPSSAVFYGALSVHLGAFLLLRAGPLLDCSPWLGAIIVIVGLMTAVYAVFVGRVQTDIKSALSFASLTQVGIIVVEIGLGLRFIPLVHILGHACLRTLQFVRAPSLLHDYRTMENAIGSDLPHFAGVFDSLISARSANWCYRLSAERGYLDAILRDYVVRPLLAVFRFFDWLEWKWTDLLAGGPSRETALDPLASESMEEPL